MTVSGSVEGSTGGNVDASISGPFQAEEGQFPQFDLTASVTGEGAGQSVDFQGGLTSTGDKLYVTYQDTPYEVPDDVFKQVQQNYQASAANTTRRRQLPGAVPAGGRAGRLRRLAVRHRPAQPRHQPRQRGRRGRRGDRDRPRLGRHQHRGDRQPGDRGDRREPVGPVPPRRPARPALAAVRGRGRRGQLRRLLGQGRRHPQAPRLQHRRHGARVGGPARSRQRRQRGLLDQSRSRQRAADDRGSVRRQAVRRPARPGRPGQPAARRARGRPRRRRHPRPRRRQRRRRRRGWLERRLPELRPERQHAERDRQLRQRDAVAPAGGRGGGLGPDRLDVEVALVELADARELVGAERRHVGGGRVLAQLGTRS